uniref:PQQ-binding-like beta-propeller repeat protein n=1 Tax=Zooxanthella nutricula TaxID=1333877 RepID=A0A7S2K996_9DINO
MGPNGIFYAEYRTSLVGPYDDDPSDSLAAYRVSDGSLLWRRHLPHRAAEYPAVGRLGPHGPLAVLVVMGQNPTFNMPAAMDAAILKGNGGGLRSWTMAVDAVTGEALWTFEDERWNSAVAAGETPGRACVPHPHASPTIGGDGTVYVASGLSGALHAIREANGDGAITPDEVTTFHASSAFLHGPALAPGMAVAAPCWGPIYVFRD